VCRFELDELPRSWDDESALFSQFGVAPEQPGHSEYPREGSGDLVRPGIARRALIDDFAAPDLAARLAGRVAVSCMILRTSPMRIFAQVARAVTPRTARPGP